MENDWKVVYTINKSYKAAMIKEILGEHNIESVEMNKRDSALGSFGTIEIYVHESNFEKASEILKDFEN